MSEAIPASAVPTLPATPPAAPPACPRCGYDLSGIATAWTDSCPLHGICSECGYPMLWGEVFDDAAGRPAWSYEHARGLAVGVLVRCVLAATDPPQLWKGLRPEHRFRPARVIGFAVGGVLLVWAVAVVVGAVLTLYGIRAYSFDRIDAFRMFFLSEDGIRRRIWLVQNHWRGSRSGPNPHVLWPAMIVMLAPAVASLSPHAMERYKLRAIHTLRAVLYTAPAVALILLLPWMIDACTILLRCLLAMCAWFPEGDVFNRAALSRVSSIENALDARMVVIVMSVAVLWTLYYIWCFARDYLRTTAGEAARMALAGVLLAGVFSTAALTMMVSRAHSPLVDFCRWAYRWLVP